MSDPIYVDKRHYDALLKKHMEILGERHELLVDWDQLTEAVSDVDPVILKKMHQYWGSIDNERAYMDGVFDTLTHIQKTMKELEEKRYVSPRSKQNPL